MKTMFTILLFMMPLLTFSQVSVTGGLGMGWAYFIENQSNNVNVDYSSTYTLFTEAAFHQPETYFKPAIRITSMSAKVVGQDWSNRNRLIDGRVSSTSVLMTLGHTSNTQNSIQFGYNGGIGFTSQTIDYNLDHSNQPNKQDQFASITLGGNIDKALSDALAITLRPTLLWTDPINSFGTGEDLQLAGEDVSIYTNIGATYLLK